MLKYAVHQSKFGNSLLAKTGLGVYGSSSNTALNLEGISGFGVYTVTIIDRFPEAQFCTRSFFIFGSYFVSRARISGIVWTLYDWPIEVIMPDCLVVVLFPDQDGKPGIVFFSRGQF